MVEATGSSTIRDELLALAAKHIEAFDSYTEVISDDEKKHYARYTTEQGNRLTVAKAPTMGASIEKAKAFYANLVANATAHNDALTMEILPEHEGNQVIYTHTKSPSMMISNRVTFSINHHIDNTDGSYTVVGSSKGNEAIAAANKSKKGKAVEANVIIDYVHFQPIDGGL